MVFFTATLDEAVALRPVVGPAPVIAVLNGYFEGQLTEFTAHDLTPVLNDPGQLADGKPNANASIRRYQPCTSTLE